MCLYINVIIILHLIITIQIKTYLNVMSTKNKKISQNAKGELLFIFGFKSDSTPFVNSNNQERCILMGIRLTEQRMHVPKNCPIVSQTEFRTQSSGTVRSNPNLILTWLNTSGSICTGKGKHFFVDGEGYFPGLARL